MPPRGDGGPSVQLSLPRMTPVVKRLLISVGVLLLVQILWDNWLAGHSRPLLAEWLALFPNRVVHGQIWRLVTYPWVQGAGAAVDLTNVAFGVIGLYMFGTALETLFGSRRFLLFVAACTLFAGLAATLAGLAGSFFNQPSYGIAPLSYALTAAWGVRFPNARLAFPPVSGRVFVYCIIGLAIIPVLMRSQIVGPVMNLSSIGVGFALAKWWNRIDTWLDARLVQQRVARKGIASLRAISGGLDPARGKKPIDKKYLN